MTFSVIVPSYTRPDDLRRCALGVLGGNRLPDELVLIVRDTDLESQALIDELARAENGHLIRKVLVTPPGQVAAINEGLKVSTGEVVCLTDDDTDPTEVWLERVAKAFDDPDVAGVGGRDLVHESPDNDLPPAEKVGLITWYGKVIGNHHRGCEGIRRVHHIKGANMSFRRSALPPFDPNLFRGASMLNDTDASLGALKHGAIVYDPEAVVIHYATERGAGVSRDTSAPEVVDADAHNWTYCMLKHLRWWQRPVFLVYAALVGSGDRIGLVKWAVGIASGKQGMTRQLLAATRGKARGVWTYLTRKKRWREWEETGAANAG